MDQGRRGCRRLSQPQRTDRPVGLSVQDVYTGTSEGAILPSGITSPEQDGGVDLWADWSGTAPKGPNATPAYDFQTTGTAGDYYKLETERAFDLPGQLRKSTDTIDRITYCAYLDGETRTYSAWDATNDETLLRCAVC